MTRVLIGGPLLVVLTVVSACVSSTQSTPAESTKVSTTASDETAARAQIDAAAKRIWDAVGRSDAAAVLAEYADDAMVMGAGAPAIEGKPAITAWAKTLFGDNTFKDVSGNVKDITVGGDIAIETGSYAMTLVRKATGVASSDRGKYLHIWKRSADGSWKVIRYMANSDLTPR